MNKFLRGCMSVASGLSLGIILVGCESLMRAMVHHARHSFVAFERENSHLGLTFEKLMPAPTKALLAFLPESDFAKVGAWIAFTVGCCWLSWQERPGVLATTSRMLIGFALVGSFVAHMPLHAQIRCLCGDGDDANWDEFTWLLLCSLPLVAAIIKHREGKVASVSTKD